MTWNGFFVSKDLPKDGIQVSVDAASPSSGSSSATGVIAVDKDGHWKGAAWMKTNWMPPYEAEISAILLGIKLASQIGASKVSIFSDSKKAVNQLWPILLAVQGKPAIFFWKVPIF